jgi:2'-5' RNA ligase
MQLFVGVWPSEKAVQALADYPHGGADGWATARQWLVNVRPLGQVAADVVPALVDALRFELDGMPKPKAALQPPRAGEWLRLEVLGLDDLRDVVFDATTPIVPITHPRSLPWAPELTLRRSRSPKDLVHPLAATWTVGEVVLAKGARTREGHGYETVESIRLG